MGYGAITARNGPARNGKVLMPLGLLIAALVLTAGPVDPEARTEAQMPPDSKLMKETARADHDIRVVGTGAKVELEEQPVLRWENARALTVDAATFVWLADHRPYVIGAMWIKNSNAWFRTPFVIAAAPDGHVGRDHEMVHVASGSFAGARGGRATTSRIPSRTTAANETACREGLGVYAVKTLPDYDDGLHLAPA